jgi:hypothetical protein
MSESIYVPGLVMVWLYCSYECTLAKTIEPAPFFVRFLLVAIKARPRQALGGEPNSR